MDIELFSRLLQNLLASSVTVVHKDPMVLQEFEEKYCFHEKLQPMFTAQALQYLIASVKDHTLYEIIDKLDVCLCLFRFDDHIFLVGPYMRKEYNGKEVQKVLIDNNLPASYALSAQLYLTAFPIQSTYHVHNTIFGVIQSFDSSSETYSYRRLQGFQEEPDEPKEYQKNEIDYSKVYRRYDIENHLLELVALGDVEHVTKAFDEMISYTQDIQSRFTTVVYQKPTSVLRALVRKEAERSGVSVLAIDEITQRSVQKMSTARNAKDEAMYIREMIIELTEAVRENHYRTEGISPAVQKVMHYITMNYTQEFSVDKLASLTGYSASHLTRLIREETGTTISRYIAHLRCKQAAEMLKHTDLSIQEISSYVGYPDNNYFVKVFKKEYGMTPSEYRK